jgi:hypothetical protein
MISALLILEAAPANAFCYAPSAPSEPWRSAPTAPYCGNYGDLSGCSEWEVENFRSEVERWLEEMQQYAYDARDYANDAIEYANCESERAVNEWNSFAGR